MHKWPTWTLAPPLSKSHAQSKISFFFLIYRMSTECSHCGQPKGERPIQHLVECHTEAQKKEKTEKKKAARAVKEQAEATAATAG